MNPSSLSPPSPSAGSSLSLPYPHLTRLVSSLPSTSACLATVSFLFHSWSSTTSQTTHSVCDPIICTSLWYLPTLIFGTYSPSIPASSCDPPRVTSGAQSLCSQAPGHLSCGSPIHSIHCHPSPYPLPPSSRPSFVNRHHHFTLLTPLLPPPDLRPSFLHI